MCGGVICAQGRQLPVVAGIEGFGSFSCYQELFFQGKRWKKDSLVAGTKRANCPLSEQMDTLFSEDVLVSDDVLSRGIDGGRRLPSDSK